MINNKMEKKSKNNLSTELLDAVRKNVNVIIKKINGINLTNDAPAELILELNNNIRGTVVMLEKYLYNGVMSGITSTIHNDNNARVLCKKFGVNSEELKILRENKYVVNPELYNKEELSAPLVKETYNSIKKDIIKETTPRALKIIEYIEKTVLLDECEAEIDKLKSRLAEVDIDAEIENLIDNSISVGFTNAEGNFENLENSRLNYFGKYSDEQLDEIYSQDENARDIIDEIRRSRGIL
jgi:hypothetical protein